MKVRKEISLKIARYEICSEFSSSVLFQTGSDCNQTLPWRLQVPPSCLHPTDPVCGDYLCMKLNSKILL